MTTHPDIIAPGLTASYLDSRPFYVHTTRDFEWYGPFGAEEQARAWCEAKGHKLFTVCRSLPSGLRPQPVGEASLTPKLLDGSPRASDYRLDHLLIHHHVARCTRCNEVAHHDEVFECWILRSQHGASPTKRLLPARVLVPGFPVLLHNLPTVELPVCSQCLSTVPAADPRPITDDEWRQTLNRKHTERPTAAQPKSGPKARPIIPSLDII